MLANLVSIVAAFVFLGGCFGNEAISSLSSTPSASLTSSVQWSHVICDDNTVLNDSAAFFLLRDCFFEPPADLVVLAARGVSIHHCTFAALNLGAVKTNGFILSIYMSNFAVTTTTESLSVVLFPAMTTQWDVRCTGSTFTSVDAAPVWKFLGDVSSVFVGLYQCTMLSSSTSTAASAMLLSGSSQRVTIVSVETTISATSSVGILFAGAVDNIDITVSGGTWQTSSTTSATVVSFAGPATSVFFTATDSATVSSPRVQLGFGGATATSIFAQIVGSSVSSATTTLPQTVSYAAASPFGLLFFSASTTMANVGVTIVDAVMTTTKMILRADHPSATHSDIRVLLSNCVLAVSGVVSISSSGLTTGIIVDVVAPFFDDEIASLTVSSTGVQLRGPAAFARVYVSNVSIKMSTALFSSSSATLSSNITLAASNARIEAKQIVSLAGGVSGLSAALTDTEVTLFASGAGFFIRGVAQRVAVFMEDAVVLGTMSGTTAGCVVSLTTTSSSFDSISLVLSRVSMTSSFLLSIAFSASCVANNFDVQISDSVISGAASFLIASSCPQSQSHRYFISGTSVVSSAQQFTLGQISGGNNIQALLVFSSITCEATPTSGTYHALWGIHASPSSVGTMINSIFSVYGTTMKCTPPCAAVTVARGVLYTSLIRIQGCSFELLPWTGTGSLAWVASATISANSQSISLCSIKLLQNTMPPSTGTLSLQQAVTFHSLATFSGISVLVQCSGSGGTGSSLPLIAMNVSKFIGSNTFTVRSLQWVGVGSLSTLFDLPVDAGGVMISMQAVVFSPTMTSARLIASSLASPTITYGCSTMSGVAITTNAFFNQVSAALYHEWCVAAASKCGIHTLSGTKTNSLSSVSGTPSTKVTASVTTLTPSTSFASISHTKSLSRAVVSLSATSDTISASLNCTHTTTETFTMSVSGTTSATVTPTSVTPSLRTPSSSNATTRSLTKSKSRPTLSVLMSPSSLSLSLTASVSTYSPILSVSAAQLEEASTTATPTRGAPLPAIPAPQTATEAAAAVTTAATTAVTVLFSGADISNANTQVMLAQLDCSYLAHSNPEDSLAVYFISPFYFMGNMLIVLGNIGIVVAVAALQLLVAFVVARRRGAVSMQSVFGDPFVRCPTVTLRIAQLLLPGVYFGSMVLLTATHDVLPVGVGAASVVLVSASLAFGYRQFLRHVFCPYIQWHAYKTDGVPRHVPRLLMPYGCWLPEDSRTAYGAAFGSMSGGHHKFQVVDFALSLSASAAAAISSKLGRVTCVAVVGVLCALYAAAAAAALWLRPYRTPHECLTSPILLAVFAAVCGLKLAGIEPPAELSLAQSIFILVRTIAQLYVMLVLEPLARNLGLDVESAVATDMLKMNMIDAADGAPCNAQDLLTVVGNSTAKGGAGEVEGQGLRVAHQDVVVTTITTLPAAAAASPETLCTRVIEDDDDL